MPLLDTSSLSEAELRTFADQYFARYAKQGYPLLGRGAMFVRIDGTEGSARPHYLPLAALICDSEEMSDVRRLATQYDPEHEAVVVYVDADTFRVLATHLVTIETVS
jgi:hypothetical protein